MSDDVDTKAEYQQYLQSEHWQRKRALVLARAGDHCERCGRFCGENPHGECMAPCSDPACEYCRTYYFDGCDARNDVEEQHLEVHHETYERRGNEWLTDLVALCWSCHEDTWDTDRAMWGMGA